MHHGQQDLAHKVLGMGHRRSEPLRTPSAGLIFHLKSATLAKSALLAFPLGLVGNHSTCWTSAPWHRVCVLP